jgi:RNA polymerase sigma-70 factor, ECF subfamily
MRRLPRITQAILPDPAMVGEDLVARARRGDREAFTLLVEGGLERVFRTASAMLNSETDARDIVQDAFLAAWQHLPTG